MTHGWEICYKWRFIVGKIILWTWFPFSCHVWLPFWESESTLENSSPLPFGKKALCGLISGNTSPNQELPRNIWKCSLDKLWEKSQLFSGGTFDGVFFGRIAMLTRTGSPYIYIYMANHIDFTNQKSCQLRIDKNPRLFDWGGNIISGGACSAATISLSQTWSNLQFFCVSCW